MQFTEFTIKKNDENRRIDRILKKNLPHIPLSGLYSNLRKGRIKLNGKKIKPSQTVKTGDKLKIATDLLPSQNLLAEKINPQPELKLEILLHDSDFLIINKPENKIVHGKNSLDNYIKNNFPAKIDSLSFKPGPLHRLDKNTTGILTFSQSLKGAQTFSRALHDNKLERYYIGIVIGKPCKTRWETINANNKKNITDVNPIYHFEKLNLTLTEFKLHTGRKHQIRIQCQKFGTPLHGDIKFGSRKTKENYLLHCYKLIFHTKILSLPKKITAPIPARFKHFLLKNNFNPKSTILEDLIDN
ncbi:MAG: pseudouridine synthase [Treponema sp.]|nr:MAG: pseudouridine synthase [Treponema sp.]